MRHYTNGERSTQRDKKSPADNIHMIPERALKKIKYFRIHYTVCIRGFTFYDKDKKLLWRIGQTYSSLSVETVMLKENEAIVCVVCKLYPGEQSRFSDF